MANAFQFKPDCPVPEIAAISGTLISSCSLGSSEILPPPPQEFCYTIERIPIIPPPSFNFGCYRSFMQGTAQYGFCLVTASLALEIGPGPLTGPIAGDLIAAIGSEAISSALAGCSNPTLDATVSYPNFGETGFCEPVYNIDLTIPCPKVKITGQASFTKEDPLKMKVTGGDTITIGAENISVDCSKNFNVDLSIPCPLFVVDIEDVVEGTDTDPIIDLEINLLPDPPEETRCRYVFDLTLTLGITTSFSFVCFVSSTGSGLVVRYQKLTFRKGVLTLVGSCT